ncbi:MAG: RcnB family protein [Sphingomonas sp.]
MRKFIIPILLASAAASPAVAQDRGHWRHDDAQSSEQQAHQDRQQAHEERQQAREQVRAERPVQAERPAQQFERRQVDDGARTFDRSRFEGRGNVAPQTVVQQQPAEQRQQREYRGARGGYAGGQQVQVDQTQRSGTWSGQRGSWSGNRDAGSWTGNRDSGSWSGNRTGGSWSGTRTGDYRQGDVSRQQTQTRWASGTWNRDWRNDRRYDWRRYRNNHRSTFHLGVYFDPFGYGYRSFDIGYRLYPNYFSQQYWIDPGLYGLPYPPPGTQWVRYWNDAVLVDMYSGEVVDVIRDFFW